ncbi:hypothetical protein N656DRAFT_200686 [Canariomyces notabilis]|uniref:Uncharacterized protein n=1 Tax=Canariomyces notabilis TaxID=2074819 RepID=A0AAN6QNK6_9PEZI|nr:hypothetical protein N656DRAFT_200686 [Canariomyces arenarius]
MPRQDPWRVAARGELSGKWCSSIEAILRLIRCIRAGLFHNPHTLIISRSQHHVLIAKYYQLILLWKQKGRSERSTQRCFRLISSSLLRLSRDCDYIRLKSFFLTMKLYTAGSRCLRPEGTRLLETMDDGHLQIPSLMQILASQIYCNRILVMQRHG